MEAVDRINGLMVQFFESRRDDPGLHRYYKSRIDSGQILDANDRHAIRVIQERFPPPAKVLEICAGVAQLGHCLACLGYIVTACEIDTQRYLLARDLRSWLQASTVVAPARWQRIVNNVDCQLIVTVNAVASSVCWEADLPVFQRQLEKGRQLLLAPKLYGEMDGGPRWIAGATQTEVGHGLVWFQ